VIREWAIESVGMGSATDVTPAEIQTRYNELLSSSVLDHDPYSRPNLHVYRPRHLRMFESVRRYLPPERRRRAADIGCHNGFFLRLCSELGFQELVAIDYNPLPAERSFLTGLPGARFVRANFNQDAFLKDLAPGSIDCLVSTEVFEHILNHPLGYLNECWRVTAPGGILLLTTPNPCTLANAVRLALGKPILWGDQAFAKTPKINGEGVPIAVWDIHYREYPASEMMPILKELPGLEILESGYLANADDPGEPVLKRGAKRLLWKAHLGNWRPLSATQYWILRKH
jgi:SAM-dependent methyltransferase